MTTRPTYETVQAGERYAHMECDVCHLPIGAAGGLVLLEWWDDEPDALVFEAVCSQHRAVLAGKPETRQ